YETGAVQTKDHGQLLDSHIVDHLVVGALHKGGVDITEHAHALCRHSRAKRHGVLLADAYVKGAIRHLVHHELERGAAWHGGCDPENPWVLLGQLDEAQTEYVLVFG